MVAFGQVSGQHSLTLSVAGRYLSKGLKWRFIPEGRTETISKGHQFVLLGSTDFRSGSGLLSAYIDPHEKLTLTGPMNIAHLEDHSIEDRLRKDDFLLSITMKVFAPLFLVLLFLLRGFLPEGSKPLVFCLAMLLLVCVIAVFADILPHQSRNKAVRTRTLLRTPMSAKPQAHGDATRIPVADEKGDLVLQDGGSAAWSGAGPRQGRGAPSRRSSRPASPIT